MAQDTFKYVCGGLNAGFRCFVLISSFQTRLPKVVPVLTLCLTEVVCARLGLQPTSELQLARFGPGDAYEAHTDSSALEDLDEAMPLEQRRMIASRWAFGENMGLGVSGCGFEGAEPDPDGSRLMGCSGRIGATRKDFGGIPKTVRRFARNARTLVLLLRWSFRLLHVQFCLEPSTKWSGL